MANSFFQFKQFLIHQDRCAMKVTTDACLFGAWLTDEVGNQESAVNSVLDIGTGTGLLGLMFAQKNPEAKIDAIEIDKGAAEQARINVDSSPWKEQINIVQADTKLFPFEKRFDLIMSNPPFYEKEIRSATDNKNIAHHGKELKLEELFRIIKNNLAADGNFFLLLPYKRNEEIRKLLKDHELQISKLLFVRQSVKHGYFRIMLKGKLSEEKDEETEFDEMSIWNENQQYTKEFTQLLNDYYLHL
ncbi:MAG TPA: methyltransferase [Chitinophagaceae bacterium]|nr:methyltransferase [Chitinophagaceae bacterium]